MVLEWAGWQEWEQAQAGRLAADKSDSDVLSREVREQCNASRPLQAPLPAS